MNPKDSVAKYLESKGASNVSDPVMKEAKGNEYAPDTCVPRCRAPWEENKMQ